MAGITPNELHERFGYHPPSTDEVKNAHEEVRRILNEVALQLVLIVPAGREQSSMVTHLEEAMYWANAGIAREQRVGG